MGETADNLQSELIDLSGVLLSELGEVGGLPEALAALRGRLAHASTPLCESGMAALCGERAVGSTARTWS